MGGGVLWSSWGARNDQGGSGHCRCTGLPPKHVREGGKERGCTCNEQVSLALVCPRACGNVNAELVAPTKLACCVLPRITSISTWRCFRWETSCLKYHLRHRLCIG